MYNKMDFVSAAGAAQAAQWLLLLLTASAIISISLQITDN